MDVTSDIFNDLKERVNLYVKDNNDYKEIFKTLKSNLINAYFKNDFRVSILKSFAVMLISIIYLVNKDKLKSEQSHNIILR